MALRDIAAVLEMSGEGRPVETPALRQAVSLAKACSARLSILIAAVKSPRPFSPFGTSFVAAMADDFDAKARARCTEVDHAARRLATEAGLDAVVDSRIEDLDAMRSDAVRIGRCHDLAVVDQPDAPLDGRGVVFETLLLESGRPVLVATRSRPPVEKVVSVLIGWDGSAFASRAVADVLALCPTVERAHIVTITGDKDLSGIVPAAELAAHLERHGLSTAVESIAATRDRDAAATLDARAVETGCDLLVIGGFARPRWREILLGGATNHLVRKANVPLLLAH
jgi:nucleotide-binding universal stress UspA family protein